MKLINDGLPKVIFEYLSIDFYDNYDKTQISATTLLKPVQEVILTQRHDDEIEVPASSRVWSLFGQATHAALELLKGASYEQEQRLRYTTSLGTITGKFDLIADGILHDYKTTSVFTLIYGSNKETWRQQLSIYSYLYYKVRGKRLQPVAKIIVIMRDWNKYDSKRIKDYPEFPIVEIPMELLTLKETEDLVFARLAKLEFCKSLTDDCLPSCTPEERWYHKKTGAYNKCEGYCLAAPFCHQLKQEQKKGGVL